MFKAPEGFKLVKIGPTGWNPDQRNKYHIAKWDLVNVWWDGLCGAAITQSCAAFATEADEAKVCKSCLKKQGAK